ncbi:Zn-ribbon domain-containing OB-fold protein [Streptodolium elevatio]|uniref:OB-fold domain-containing protein n=1 Tax=Streptodolium elevatio TaxID=3157996 RepID=A0ABV3DHC6_9ACTN
MIIGITRRDPATEEFFDGTARGELLIRRCSECAHGNAPQNTACARCGGADLAWTPAQGTGTIASWTVVHGRPADGEDAPAVVIAIVELTEGPWLHARILGADPRAVATGQEVVVDFVQPEGGEAVPVFRPRRR